jgi:hypothetical protein
VQDVVEGVEFEVVQQYIVEIVLNEEGMSFLGKHLEHLR